MKIEEILRKNYSKKPCFDPELKKTIMETTVISLEKTNPGYGTLFCTDETSKNIKIIRNKKL